MGREGLRGEVLVELFGTARLTAGRKEVPLALGPSASLRDVLLALKDSCPTLVGRALQPEGGLLPGWVLNVNGRSFVDRLEARVAPGDSVLLLSDQTGG